MSAVRSPNATITEAECLVALQAFHADARCRRCECLDWALDQLQGAGDRPVASAAARLRVAPEVVSPPPDCRPCLPLEATLAWLTSGRHIAGL